MGAVRDDSAWEAARAAYCDAFVAARAADDVDAMAAAALGLASLQRFGGPGGRTPALLHEAYLAAVDSPAMRARLAAALARSWVYGNDAARGASFALEAVELAEQTRDPTVLADALDAQLATSWGPDDLPGRLHVTSRLQDVAARVDDVRTRMDAHLWRLTTALEMLDITGMQRQLAALDLLAGETGSPLVRYFAMTRRAMYATLVDDLDRAGELVEAAYALGTAIGVPDALAVYHEQRSETTGQIIPDGISRREGPYRALPASTARWPISKTTTAPAPAAKPGVAGAASGPRREIPRSEPHRAAAGNPR